MAKVDFTKIKNLLPKLAKHWPAVVGIAGSVLIGAVLGGGITNITIQKDENGKTNVVVENSFQMELSEEQVPTEIVTADGTIQTIDAPTVEAIDDGEAAQEIMKDAGRGWYVDISTPETFKSAIYGQCVDYDGAYGSQCYDTAALFWENSAGRWLSTCNTGAAKGTWNGDNGNCKYYNAGDDFALITDPTQLRPGDIVVFNTGTWGHIGMALGYYNNGYIALLGTNQGGTPCSGGGSTANIINISLKDFAGAFRWHGYDHLYEQPVEPEPTIPITGCLDWYVEKGDTMSKIMLNCEGTVVYGEGMNAYAKSWYSRYIKPGQSVYDGWHSASGVGLYATDTIDHKVGN